MVTKVNIFIDELKLNEMVIATVWINDVYSMLADELIST